MIKISGAIIIKCLQDLGGRTEQNFKLMCLLLRRVHSPPYLPTRSLQNVMYF